MIAKESRSALKTIGQDYTGVIPKRELFSLAKEFQHLRVPEVVKLLKDDNHGHRLGAAYIFRS